jgi:hypothetical protein
VVALHAPRATQFTEEEEAAASSSGSQIKARRRVKLPESQHKAVKTSTAKKQNKEQPGQDDTWQVKEETALYVGAENYEPSSSKTGGKGKNDGGGGRKKKVDLGNCSSSEGVFATKRSVHVPNHTLHSVPQTVKLGDNTKCGGSPNSKPECPLTEFQNPNPEREP